MGEKFYISALFEERFDSFTIYVVEKLFSLDNGKEYFKKYYNSKHYICNNSRAVSYRTRLINWINKNIPNVASIMEYLLGKPLTIGETIIMLSKIFSVEEHVAVGPEIIDPIIIEEENVSIRNMENIISMNKGSCLQPTIIIILKDNDFDRAKNMLKGCPNNTIVKLIKNSGESCVYRIANSGANNVNGFLDAFSRQCFSTCSNTKSEILLSSDYNDNMVINKLLTSLLKVRSCFIEDRKDEDVKKIINNINIEILKLKTANLSLSDKKLLYSFDCMNKLFEIYCFDNGQNLLQAETLADELGSDILRAHTYRFSHYKNISLEEKQQNYTMAEKLFRKYQIADHAAYCKNNNLVLSFYKEFVNTKNFEDLLTYTKNETPGLVGMSIIASNAGTAHLYNLNYTKAIDIYDQNIHYASFQISQKYGMLCNKKIAEHLSGKHIDDNETNGLVRDILFSFGTTKIPFIAANLLMNLISISLQQKKDTALAKEILNIEQVQEIFKMALKNNQLGSGSLCYQIAVLNQKYSNFFSSFDFDIPATKSELTGIRKRFIEQYGLNPTIHNAWL